LDGNGRANGAYQLDLWNIFLGKYIHPFTNKFFRYYYSKPHQNIAYICEVPSFIALKVEIAYKELEAKEKI